MVTVLGWGVVMGRLMCPRPGLRIVWVEGNLVDIHLQRGEGTMGRRRRGAVFSRRQCPVIVAHRFVVGSIDVFVQKGQRRHAGTCLYLQGLSKVRGRRWSNTLSALAMVSVERPEGEDGSRRRRPAWGGQIEHGLIVREGDGFAERVRGLVARSILMTIVVNWRGQAVGYLTVPGSLDEMAMLLATGVALRSRVDAKRIARHGVARCRQALVEVSLLSRTGVRLRRRYSVW